MANPYRYLFGAYEFDATKLELRKKGELVPLPPQAALALSRLLFRAGHVVARDELRNSVWVPGTHVDVEHGLSLCVSQIHVALDEDPEKPRYLHILGNKGYKFVGPVEQILLATPTKKKNKGQQQQAPQKNFGIFGSKPANPVAKAASPVKEASPAASAPTTNGKSAKKVTPSSRKWILAACFVAFLAIAFYEIPNGLRERWLSGPPPSVAVIHFENQTSNQEFTSVASALTSNVVEGLISKSAGHFEVRAGSPGLRVPGTPADVTSAAATLHANYLILGQIQGNETQVRIIARLVRASDQAAIGVSRFTHESSEFEQAEPQDAQSIVAEFAQKISADMAGPPLPKAPNQ